MPIYYLTTEEIIKLKRDLMSKRSKSCSYYAKRKQNNGNNFAKSFSELYKQSRNSEIGQVFKENVRQTLNVEYHWTKATTERHFFFRIITIENKKYLILKDYTKKLVINGRRFKFSFYPNQSVSIYSGGPKRRFITNIDEKTKIIDLNGVEIKISGVKEIEIDCFYKIHSNFENIIGDDIKYMYSNVNKEELKNAEYACCEIKLNKSKIKSLVDQLVKDKDYLENLMRFKKIVYVGFVGSGFIDNKILNNLQGLRNINLAIFEIKNFIWLQRDLTNYIDWKNIKELKEIKQEIKETKEENQKLKMIIKSLGIETDDDKRDGQKGY